MVFPCKPSQSNSSQASRIAMGDMPFPCFDSPLIGWRWYQESCAPQENHMSVTVFISSRLKMLKYRVVAWKCEMPVGYLKKVNIAHGSLRSNRSYYSKRGSTRKEDLFLKWIFFFYIKFADLSKGVVARLIILITRGVSLLRARVEFECIAPIAKQLGVQVASQLYGNDTRHSPDRIYVPSLGVLSELRIRWTHESWHHHSLPCVK
jgi:hypothetical protein